jgi:hypothetical protein
MEQDEVGTGKARIVEQRLEVEGVSAGDGKVAAAARHSVEVDSHAEAAALGGDGVKEEVLEAFVGSGIGAAIVAAVADVGCVGSGGLVVCGVADVEWAEVGKLEFDGYSTTCSLTGERGKDEAGDVLVERGWELGEAGGFDIAGAEFVFEREKLDAVGGVGDG